MMEKVLERFKAVGRERDNWVKMLIGGSLLWIPVVNAISFGYLLDMVAGVRRGEGAKLPEWQNPGKFFLNGLPFSIIGIILWFLVMALSPVIGLGQLLMLAFYSVSPIIFLTVGTRMLDTGDWKEAIHIGSITDAVQKHFKPLLPLLGAHLIALLLCSATALLLAILTFCLLGLGGLFGFSIAYFYSLVALLPLFTESMYLDQASTTQTTAQTPAAADAGDKSPNDVTMRMDAAPPPASTETDADTTRSDPK